MSEEDYGLGLPRGGRVYIKRTDRRVRHLDCRLQTISCWVRRGAEELGASATERARAESKFTGWLGPGFDRHCEVVILW